MPTATPNQAERNRLFALGRDVSLALPRGVSSLRPSKAELEHAATTLGITQAQAKRTLIRFNDA